MKRCHYYPHLTDAETEAQRAIYILSPCAVVAHYYFHLHVAAYSANKRTPKDFFPGWISYFRISLSMANISKSKGSEIAWKAGFQSQGFGNGRDRVCNKSRQESRRESYSSCRDSSPAFTQCRGWWLPQASGARCSTDTSKRRSGLLALPTAPAVLKNCLHFILSEGAASANEEIRKWFLFLQEILWLISSTGFNFCIQRKYFCFSNPTKGGKKNCQKDS